MGKKILVYLEQYVEWVAVTLGGLWLIYMLLGYVLGTPVKVQLGAQEVTPGSVDRRIVDTAVNQLDVKMQPSVVPAMIVRPYGELFVDAISFKGVNISDIGTPQMLWAIAPSMIIPDGPPSPDEDLPRAIAVPTAVAAAYDSMSTGRSVVDLGNVAGVPAPATGNADRDWVSVAFTIPTAGLKASFEAAKVPKFLGTTFLNVELVRQEKLPDDTWGPETVVGALAFLQAPSFPANGAPNQQLDFERWATDHVGVVLQPPFYKIRATEGGDVWREPGYFVPVPAAANPVAPEPPVGNPLVRPVRPPRPIPGVGAPPVPTRRPNRPPTENFLPVTDDAAQRVTPFGQALPRRPQPGPGRPPMFDDTAQPGDNQAPAGFARPDFAGPGSSPDQPPGPALPLGVFNVTTLGPEVRVWAHDDTVIPEHTYRYKVRYSIRNPLFQRPDSAVKPEFTQIWAITSPDSNWSTEVTVQARAYFFLVGGGGIGSPTARFKIFKWQDGVWRTITDAVSPGDQVGKDLNGVDFGTGWTVVDVRRDPQRPNQSYTLLVNDRGELVRRTAEVDATDPKQKELNDLTNPAGAAPAAGGPVPPAGFPTPTPFAGRGR